MTLGMDSAWTRRDRVPGDPFLVRDAAMENPQAPPPSGKCPGGNRAQAGRWDACRTLLPPFPCVKQVVRAESAAGPQEKTATPFAGVTA